MWWVDFCDDDDCVNHELDVMVDWYTVAIIFTLEIKC